MARTRSSSSLVLDAAEKASSSLWRASAARRSEGRATCRRRAGGRRRRPPATARARASGAEGVHHVAPAEDLHADTAESNSCENDMPSSAAARAARAQCAETDLPFVLVLLLGGRVHAEEGHARRGDGVGSPEVRHALREEHHIASGDRHRVEPLADTGGRAPALDPPFGRAGGRHRPARHGRRLRAVGEIEHHGEFLHRLPGRRSVSQWTACRPRALRRHQQLRRHMCGACSASAGRRPAALDSERKKSSSCRPELRRMRSGPAAPGRTGARRPAMSVEARTCSRGAWSPAAPPRRRARGSGTAARKSAYRCSCQQRTGSDA